jgi:pimeloyl-ACP methyl ester carboxylesterase
MVLPSFLPHNYDAKHSTAAPPESPSSYRETMQLAPPAMSICLTGVMSTEGSCNVPRTLSDGSKLYTTIRYRVFRPRQLRMDPPPLVVLHGGPGVPCNYLLPLVNVVTDRAVIFYDQIGCGRSSRPEDEEAYSIDLSVDDLEALFDKWKLPSYHLYGHSWGGILAFEYLKRTRDQKCLSVILASTPTSVTVVEAESKRLLEALVEEGDDGERQAMERFRCKHECQALPIPLNLLDAYAQAAKTWRGIQAIPGYVASLNENEETGPLMLTQPAFFIRGQDDFVTQACIDDWSKLFSDTQTMVLAGCSHHALLENEKLYGVVVSCFLVDHDPKKNVDEKVG